jgi:hypothetical protein
MKLIYLDKYLALLEDFRGHFFIMIVMYITSEYA